MDNECKEKGKPEDSVVADVSREVASEVGEWKEEEKDIIFDKREELSTFTYIIVICNLEYVSYFWEYSKGYIDTDVISIVL